MVKGLVEAQRARRSGEGPGEARRSTVGGRESLLRTLSEGVNWNVARSDGIVRFIIEVTSDPSSIAPT